MKLVKTFVWVFFVISVGLFSIAMISEVFSWDSSKPIIESEQDEITVSCDYSYEDITQGLKASDDKDGDLTSKILVGNLSRFIDKGVCDLTYVVFDSSNQSASLTRRVRFSDYEAPQLKANGPLVFEVKEGDYQKAMAKVSVSDMLDGTSKDAVNHIESNVMYSTEGKYSMTLQAMNSLGDSDQVKLPVHIVSQGSMNVEISLSQYIVYVHQGDEFDASSLISDKQTGSLTKAQVKVDSSNVNTAKPGVYEVKYSASQGGQSGVTWATVVVR